MTCHDDTPCHGCQEHDTLRHAKFPDTLRSDLRLVGSVVKYHGSKNSTKLLISRSAREKTYSSSADHWRLGKPRHFVMLKTVYYLLSDKFCAFSVLDLLRKLTKGFVSFFQVSCLGLFKLNIANHWRLGKPRHFVMLKTVYYLLSDKFCAFSVLDLLRKLTKGFVSLFQVSCLGLFKL